VALDEIPQHLKGLWAEFDLAGPPGQVFGMRIERKVDK
jgi:hypothetical protein